MANESRDHASPAQAHKAPSYPLNRVGAAVVASDVERVLAALEAAGYPRSEINLMSPDNVPPLDEPIGGPGWRGFLTRLNLSVGDHLDDIEDAREELKRGHTLILVPVHGDEDQERVHTIFRENCGHNIRFFGRWAVRRFDDGAN